ncbi:hypothetical protein CCACVL1_26174 [Corchorus capsularis]|uniref:Uncharacterized protein n=1 Tax=Corchorus capsularis TaxID=210143 RepID=A0A1R3GFQ2_COCAP|nr:hypothetical protein CCACVL1_26174 [Corchorus capsularis]
MESERKQTAPKSESVPSSPTSTVVCERPKPDKDAGFVTNMRARFDGFIHAPMDEHKACFKQSFQKVFGSWNWNDNNEQRDTFKSIKSLFVFEKKN